MFDSSEKRSVMLEPPVKSIPGLSPGAKIRNTIPGAITSKEIMKNQNLFPTKSNLQSP